LYLLQSNNSIPIADVLLYVFLCERISDRILLLILISGLEVANTAAIILSELRFWNTLKAIFIFVL